MAEMAGGAGRSGGRKAGGGKKGDLPFLGLQAVRLAEPVWCGCALQKCTQTKVEKTGSILI